MVSSRSFSESDDFRDLLNVAASEEVSKITHTGNRQKVHGNLAVAAYVAVKPEAFVKFLRMHPENGLMTKITFMVVSHKAKEEECQCGKEDRNIAISTL